MTERRLFRAAVYAILKKEGKILLLRRYNTGWSDGLYTLPSGHVDDESASDAVLREAFEEAGVRIKPENSRFVHVAQHESDIPYMDFYFEIDSWEGEPHSMEPDRCDDMRWVEISKLDDYPIIENVRDALRLIDNGDPISWYVYAEKDADK